MSTYEYCRLIAKEQRIQQQIKNLIISTLKGHGGRITFTPNKPDDDKCIEYPITATLNGKNDTYNINITDVYLVEICNTFEIYADGIDNQTGNLHKEFYILPEQYSDVLYFILEVSGWSDGDTTVNSDINSEIMELACQLAEKDLVDKYDVLPADMSNEDGEYFEKYQDEFNSLYDMYYKQLSDLADFELKNE